MPVTALPRTRLRPSHLLLGIAALLLCVLLAVLTGAAELGWQRVLGELVAQVTGGVSPLSEREAAILWQLRVPRVVLGALVGAALAVSGAAFQGVFRNPLADPYLLGSAAGAGLAVTTVIAVAPELAGGMSVPLQVAAFAGALGGVGLTWAVGRVSGADAATLVLAGVAVGAFLTAGQTFVQQLRLESLEQVYMWILGRLTTTGWREVLLVLPYLAVAVVVLCLCGRLLDLLGTGDEEAAALGVRPGRVRALVLVAASLATAAAVSVAGLIGFVGLVVPHLVRLAAGSGYRVIVPLSLLFGGAFLVLADMLARTVMAPAELPIGVITAFTGAPFFAVLLYARRTA
ncbi:iron complex transport system permease protein [Saccharopolyspora erythraea NRRL 2338]|uniref:ABC-type transporter, permease component n=2 Tax=Saccharopolyspora erythraea TaxID=1836 RepID=A4FLK4_SACEN|nr:iron ABC transporter permease [Saccharopolyspora erythraea]EQD82976.1 ABC transporter permease [Saccharopolyspora erythraea D]PFG98569.1 iron complex transport system permease protein [Saccharopolyspora erythraea NRRL 2338]QRK88608.1 iron ABC transporter permease [Saccharopolyspora erythraea]CAM04929.1 ABC-type transporter, permease component [Saccharopolyspora erythraea NRRL 2338]